MKLKYDIDPRGRHCGICNLFLPWEEYSIAKRAPNGRFNICKMCLKESRIEKKNRESYEERYLKNK